MDGWMCWELPWGRTSVEGMGEWEGRGVWSDLPQLSAFSQCEKPSLELLDLMFLKMLSSIPSCVAACSHKMFSAVFRRFEQLHNSSFNTFDICLFFFFFPLPFTSEYALVGQCKAGKRMKVLWHCDFSGAYNQSADCLYSSFGLKIKEAALVVLE